MKKVSGSASSTMAPSAINRIRSATRRAKLISWVTTTMVMPPLARSVMTSRTSLIISGSRAEVGSSKSITLGSMARARAMATRCCWPPDSCAGYLSAWAAMPTRSSSFSAVLRASSLLTLRTLVGASVTLSRMVMWLNRLNCWNTMPTSARSLASSLPSSGSSSPSMRISPSSMVSRRLMVRHSVDLPDPEGPRITTTWPAGTSRLMSRSAWYSPKCLFTPLSSIIGLETVGSDMFQIISNGGHFYEIEAR